MEDDFYIVAIGASAGGLEAIIKLFQNIPPNTGAAFIIVRHLKRDYPSMQKNLLQPHTKMEVRTIREGEVVKRNKVYLLPENKLLKIKNKVLHLLPRPEELVINMAIDEFFFSFAEDVKEKAIGVILTGLGTDGTKGAYEIEKYGGIVMVQEPEQAQFDGMPKSVIYFDHPDYILKLEEIGNYVISHIQKPKIPRYLSDESASPEEREEDIGAGNHNHI